jgi:hypothetical protein
VVVVEKGVKKGRGVGVWEQGHRGRRREKKGLKGPEREWRGSRVGVLRKGGRRSGRVLQMLQP